MKIRILRLYCILILTASVSARAGEILFCQGDMGAFSSDGKTFFEINRKGEGFHITDQEAMFIRFGLKPKTPWLDLLPWGRVTFREYSENYKKDFEITTQTFSKNQFAIHLRGRKTGFTQHLSCSLKSRLVGK